MHQHIFHHYGWTTRACLNIKTVFVGIGIPIKKIRWSHNHHFFIMGIPILYTFLYWDVPLVVWSYVPKTLMSVCAQRCGTLLWQETMLWIWNGCNTRLAPQWGTLVRLHLYIEIPSQSLTFWHKMMIHHHYLFLIFYTTLLSAQNLV